MIKRWIVFTALVLAVVGCNQGKSYPERSEFTVKEYAAAVKRVEANDPAGLIKLYQIAANVDDAYTDEYGSVANEKLHIYLHSKPTLWIKTFSQVDLIKFKAYIKVSGIAVTKLPQGVSSDEQFAEEIFSSLKKIKGDENELELIKYILDVYERH